MQQMNCKSCGAPLQIENQFIRSVTCAFCGTAYIVSGDSTLDATGKTAALGNYPSRLKVYSKGTILGRGFTVLGRIRYTYDEGFWDEWQIGWDDGAPPSWLEEDEGYWTVYNKQRVRDNVPPYDQIRVGANANINGQSVFISEKRKGKVMGSEGQFAAVMPIQGGFGYVQGTGGGKMIAVNYWDEEIEVSVGDELEHHQVQVS